MALSLSWLLYIFTVSRVALNVVRERETRAVRLPVSDGWIGELAV